MLKKILMQGIVILMIIALLGILFLMVFTLATSRNWSKDFDVSEDKSSWDGNINEDFSDDSVFIIFKQSYTCPILEIEDLKLENVESIQYFSKSPTDRETMKTYGFSDAQCDEYYASFHQNAIITLKEKSKKNVVDAINSLERLVFIQSVCPNYYYEIYETNDWLISMLMKIQKRYRIVYD